MPIGRRAALSGLLACALARRAAAADSASPDDGLDIRAIRVAGAAGTGADEHEVLLALPRRADRAAPLRAAPLVVMLHGLGETVDERLGSRASTGTGW